MWPLYGKSKGKIEIYKAKFFTTEKQRVMFLLKNSRRMGIDQAFTGSSTKLPLIGLQLRKSKGALYGLITKGVYIGRGGIAYTRNEKNRSKRATSELIEIRFSYTRS